MSQNPIIDVLLATYRPQAAMLKAQVDSIRAQRGVDVNLICHEDEEGIGACLNFSRLLDKSTAEYVAFSDQDDVWRKDKLARSMEKMRELERQFGKDVPLLVFTDATVVDADLNELGPSLFRWSKINPTRTKPGQLALQNVANGNTMLFNAALREKAKPIPDDAFMHDHWIMLVAAVFGQIGYVPESTVLYRQHGRNVIGGSKVGVGYFVRKLAGGRTALRNRLYANVRQSKAFVARYGESAPPALRALASIEGKSWAFRVATLLRHRIFKFGLLRNIGTWLLV